MVCQNYDMSPEIFVSSCCFTMRSLWVFRSEKIAVCSVTSAFYGLTALLKGITEFLNSWVNGTSYRKSWRRKKILCQFTRKSLQGLLYSSFSFLISLTFYHEQLLLCMIWSCLLNFPRFSLNQPPFSQWCLMKLTNLIVFHIMRKKA